MYFPMNFAYLLKNTFLKEDLLATLSIDIRKNVDCLGNDVATKFPQTHLWSMTQHFCYGFDKIKIFKKKLMTT